MISGRHFLIILNIWGQSKNMISGRHFLIILSYFYSDPKYHV